jgi:hypothetical protein
MRRCRSNKRSLPNLKRSHIVRQHTRSFLRSTYTGFHLDQRSLSRSASTLLSTASRCARSRPSRSRRHRHPSGLCSCVQCRRNSQMSLSQSTPHQSISCRTPQHISLRSVQSTQSYKYTSRTCFVISEYIRYNSKDRGQCIPASKLDHNSRCIDRIFHQSMKECKYRCCCESVYLRCIGGILRCSDQSSTCKGCRRFRCRLSRYRRPSSHRMRNSRSNLLVASRARRSPCSRMPTDPRTHYYHRGDYIFRYRSSRSYQSTTAHSGRRRFDPIARGLHIEGSHRCQVHRSDRRLSCTLQYIQSSHFHCATNLTSRCRRYSM